MQLFFYLMAKAPILNWCHTSDEPIWLLCRMGYGVGSGPWMRYLHLRPRPSPAIPPFLLLELEMVEMICTSIPPWMHSSRTMHYPSEFEPGSWLLCIFWYCISISPAPLSQFCNSEIHAIWAVWVKKRSVPIIPRRCTFLWPIGLLYRLSLVMAGALRWGRTI